MHHCTFVIAVVCSGFYFLFKCKRQLLLMLIVMLQPPPPPPEFPPFPIRACVLGKVFSGKTTVVKKLADGTIKFLTIFHTVTVLFLTRSKTLRLQCKCYEISEHSSVSGKCDEYWKNRFVSFSKPCLWGMAVFQHEWLFNFITCVLCFCEHVPSTLATRSHT